MGGFGALTGLAQFGSDIGQAAGETRAFDLAKQNILSQIAERQAQALYQRGTLGVQQSEQALKQREFEAGKFFIDQRQPYITNPDGSYSLVEYNRLGGQPRVTRMPQGFMPPDTPEAFAQQLRRALPGMSEEQVQAVVGAKYGLMRNPYLGLSPVVTTDANGNPVVGTLNRMNNTVTPATMAGSGKAANKPVNSKFVTTVDANGNELQTPVAAYVNPQSQVPSAAKGSGVSGAPPAPHQMVKKFAQFPAAAVDRLGAINDTQSMLQQVKQQLEAVNPSTGQPYYADSQGFDKIKSVFENYLYTHGIAPDDPWEKLIQTTGLEGFTAIKGLVPGIRRGDLIKAAWAHLPEGGNTPTLMYQKVLGALPLYDMLKQNLVNVQRANLSGGLAAGNVPPNTPVAGAAAEVQPPDILKKYLAAPPSEYSLSDGSVWRVGGGKAVRVK